MKRTGLLWIAAVIAIGGCSNTDRAKPPASDERPGAAVGTGGAGADVKSDGDFVQDLAMKNIAEIELSRMAVDKSNSAEVSPGVARAAVDGI